MCTGLTSLGVMQLFLKWIFPSDCTFPFSFSLIITKAIIYLLLFGSHTQICPMTSLPLNPPHLSGAWITREIRLLGNKKILSGIPATDYIAIRNLLSHQTASAPFLLCSPLTRNQQLWRMSKYTHPFTQHSNVVMLSREKSLWTTILSLEPAWLCQGPTIKHHFSSYLTLLTLSRPQGAHPFFNWAHLFPFFSSTLICYKVL